MTRREWKRSYGALRKLISGLLESPNPGRYNQVRRVSYKFGAVYHRQHAMWYLYHGITDNVFATLKIREDDNPRTIVRVRPASFYAPFLSSIVLVGDTIVIESENMGTNRDWVRQQLRDRVRSAVADERRSRRVVRPRVSLSEAATFSPQPFDVREIQQRMMDSYMQMQVDGTRIRMRNPEAWVRDGDTVSIPYAQEYPPVTHMYSHNDMASGTTTSSTSASSALTAEDITRAVERLEGHEFDGTVGS